VRAGKPHVVLGLGGESTLQARINISARHAGGSNYENRAACSRPH